MGRPEDSGENDGLFDELERGFPPPYDGEPPDLRRDIADELTDHLACALERERERTDDEAQARRAALARFGDPLALARKLWFEAMKERIMKDRIMFISVVLLALAAVAGATFTWQAMQQSQRANQAMLAALEKLAGGQSTMSKDKGELQITVTKDDQEKTPVKGLDVRLIGQLFGANPEDLNLSTDERGMIKCGPINPCRLTLSLDTLPMDGVQLKHFETAVVFAGQQAKAAITYPDLTTAPVSVVCDQAAELKGVKKIVGAHFVAATQVNSSQWTTDLWLGVNLENGNIFKLDAPRNDWPNLVMNDLSLQTLNQPANWPAIEYKLAALIMYNNPDNDKRYLREAPINFLADQQPTFKIEPGKPNEIKIKLPEEMVKRLQWTALLQKSPDSVKNTDPNLGELVTGQIRQVLPATKDCMILSYIPDWGRGDVDNIAVANNEGGVRTLINWPEVPKNEALQPGRKFLLALFSRQTKTQAGADSAIKVDAPMTTATSTFNTSLSTTGTTTTLFAHAITADWPELTSWKTQPPVDPLPAAQCEFQPGDGWKLFDVTPLVRARAEGKDAQHGIMLRFAQEDRPSTDWSGYQFVSREGSSDGSSKHPVLLAVDEKE